MKQITLLLAVSATLGSVAFGIFQYFTASAEKNRADSSEAALRLTQAELDSVKALLTDMERRLLAFQAEADALRKKRAEVVAENPNPESNAESRGDETEGKKAGLRGLMAGLGKMLKGPTLKAMMHKQQMLSVRMEYDDLSKLLNLSAQEQDRLMELLSDRQNVGSEMLSGISEEGADKDSQLKEVDKQRNDIEKQIKQLVGEDGMKEIQKYEKSMPDRMAIDAAGHTLRASDMPLDEGQRQRLLAIMSEERARIGESPFDRDSKDTSALMKSISSPEMIESHIRNQQVMLQRVLNRTNTVLTPDQYSAFEESLKGQFEMNKFGLQFIKDAGKQAAKGPVPVPARE